MSDQKKKILVTGANGLLGSSLVPLLVWRGFDVVATGRGENRVLDPQLIRSGNIQYVPLDLLDGVDIEKKIISMAPDQIVHAGAQTQVDFCEQNPVECWNTNVTATRFIISAAEKVNAGLVYVSTDFVFSGEKGMYREEDDPGPVNYYGSSKLAAEKSVMGSCLNWSIARTVLVYGNSKLSHRTNILTWVRDELTRGKSIKVVNDQVRTPTFVNDLAEGICLMIEKNASGIFHLSGKDVLTPYEMAIAAAEYFSLDTSLITPVDASTFSQPAKRPLKTGFNIDKAKRELGYSPTAFSLAISKAFNVLRSTFNV
ncbi:NAD(P)-dependent oxidoreductase [Pollutibacter soli]|uniref:SDR family oxidoreductase n=1 Tax=Pollutibacter soli TaxID=3034157 RepID=UPI003013583C